MPKLSRIVNQVKHLIEQKLLRLSVHMSSPWFLKGVHFDQSLIFCVISYRPFVFLYCVLVILEVSVHRHTTSDYPIVLLKLFILLYDIINSMWVLFELQELFLMHHIPMDIDYRQCLTCCN